MNESALYKELGKLTKDRSRWEESIPFVSSLLSHESVKIQAKALWLLGEIGLAYPHSVQGAVSVIASFCDSPAPLLRERAVNALGRIGRGDFRMIEPYWASLFRLASDEEAKVRLSFIWASENIATNTPDIYENHMPIFAELLRDADDRVRMEAPEIFRVLGKRRPSFVRPYEDELQRIAETDDNRVVRIHCLGAVKATVSKQTKRDSGRKIMIKLETERLSIYTASQNEMQKIIDEQTDESLKTAYLEMLQGALKCPDQWAWYAIWIIKRKDGTKIGDLCFKGLNNDGSVEIGYGILDNHQRHGYATEAVETAVSWALSQPGVTRVEAETEPSNRPSQRVLEKCGFIPTGTVGEEGPRFVKVL